MPPRPHPPHMTTAQQYARYRQDRTTIWVSKNAAAFLARERATVSVGTVLDRHLPELRRARRGAGGASSGAAKKAGAKKAGAKRARSA